MRINKKGFTLIELLAVIVVLAIVMLIATTSVLPIIGETRENGFATTADTIVGAVRTVSLSDQINDRSKNCYTISELINDGYVLKIPLSTDNSTNGYNGIVQIENGEFIIHLADYTNGYAIIKNVSSRGNSSKEDIGYKKLSDANLDTTILPSDISVTCPTP